MTAASCWVGTSWKMNKTVPEAMAFVAALREVATDGGEIQRFVIPSYTAIRTVSEALRGTDVLVGAQNMHWADDGAWTGEISPLMLRDAGASLVELGHSERRAHFGETDETVARKVRAACRHGLIPLVCIGETEAERAAGRADEVLATQVTGALSQVPERGVPTPILFAYEPVWAIGTSGTPASPAYADERQAVIRSVAAAALGTAPPVLYGGSVSDDNAAELIVMPHIDGLFIGRAAWSARGYLTVLDTVRLARAGATQGRH